MICRQCGAKIEDEVSVCPFCGEVYKEDSPIAEEENTDTSAETLEETVQENSIDKMLDENEQKRKRQLERMQAEKQHQLDEIEKRRQDKKKRQRRNQVIAVVLCLLVAGGIAAGYYFASSNRDKPPVDEVVVTEAPSEDVTEMPTETPEATVAPSETVAPTEEAASWQATGGGATASSTGSSANTGATKAPSVTKAPTATKAPVKNSSKPATSVPKTGGVEYSSTGGFADGKFTGALVTGGEIVTNGNKRYMSYRYNGATYYANIDSGTTTAMISGKPLTITAFATSEVYNGANIYEITSITNYNGSYIFPNSGFALLTEKDLSGKSAAELALGRNEIYARHGRQFKTAEFDKYFKSCSWYHVNPSYNYEDDDANLNSFEKYNVRFIKKYEESRK